MKRRNAERRRTFPDRSARRVGRRPKRVVRRGVASVLAMMFLVIFGSLCAVMAVVAQGNLRTAASYLKVSRATGAAETGLVFARRRLDEAGQRFVITKGVVDGEFGTKLWLGTYTMEDGEVTVLPPEGFAEGTTPAGLAQAVRNAHLADAHSLEIEPGDSLLPDIDEFGTLRVRPIALSSEENPPYFRLKYEPLADGRFVRVTSQGVDGDVQRTLQMDFRITKKIEFAVVSPNRVMIGKNVRIEGPLGTRYGVVAGELDPENGDPLVMRSDFYHLSDDLDANLDVLYDAIAAYDVDGDARLRPAHPTEQNGLTDPALVDLNGDEYVDDYDLFLDIFDQDDDGRIVYDGDRAFEVGLGALDEEFSDIDDQLASLIDHARPDRNGDGVSDLTDVSLGYDNGVVENLDLYAKVEGELAFAVTKEAWEDEHGASYQTIVQGPIRPETDHAPVTFGVPDDELLDITTADFAESQSWFKNKALAGVAFDMQVADNLGGTPGATFTPSDAAEWETVPFGARGYYDWYRRPVYENMVFRDLEIPLGNNGLFINCTFIGATYIRTREDNSDANWNFVGMVDRNPGTGLMEAKYPGLTVEVDGVEVDDTRPYSNNIRFHGCTFAGSVVSDTPLYYSHVRNKIQFTGNTTFTLDHDELTQAEIEELEKTSIYTPGYSVDVGNFTNQPGQKVELTGTIIAGVMDVRGSADVHGTLLMTYRPTVGEGPLYYGGTPDFFNTTLGYFGPDDGDSESVDPSELTDTDGDGVPDIGIDLDGDGVNDPFQGFGEITLRYNPDAKLPDGIPWTVTVAPEPGTYTEGGSM